MSYANPSTILRNTRVVLPERILDSAGVLINEGRIARIFDSPASPPASANSVLDLAGLTLFPGFIDIHIHGAVGIDTMSASADDLRCAGEFLASQGVTAWLPTLVPSSDEQYEQAIGAVGSAMLRQNSESLDTGYVGARLLGVHYEGPFVNGEQCGALHREHFRKYATPTDLDKLPTIEREGAIHMMTVAPEVEGGIELIKELRSRGWITSIGHTRATPDILDQAFAAGARHMTHFMNAMTPLHHRAPGPVGWGLLRDDVTCDVIADGVHIDPFMLKLIVKSKCAETISLISDAIAATGLRDGDYEVWGETISVKHGRTQNSRGSIAGSVITLLHAVRMMLSLGASEVEVARMASTNPARLIGIDRDCGSIEERKRADLVALDQDGNVRFTIIGGQVSEVRP